jgi:hypothetical protein
MKFYDRASEGHGGVLAPVQLDLGGVVQGGLSFLCTIQYNTIQ